MNLVSVCAAAATVGVLTVVVTQAVPTWTGGAQDDVTASTLQLALRDAQQRAVGDGRAMCVRLDRTRDVSATPGRCDSDLDSVTFFPDGSATAATFRIGSNTLEVHPASGQVIRR